MPANETPQYYEGPPAWMPRCAGSVPGLVNRLLGTPDRQRSGCTLTAILADVDPPALWLARLAPAPFCVGDGTGPVEPLLGQLTGIHPRAGERTWAALVVDRTYEAPRHCDTGWMYALLAAAALHRLPVMDVVIAGPEGSRQVCADAPLPPLAHTGPRRWPTLRRVFDVDPATCLQPYGKTRMGQWNLPRGCALT